jgi:hypothetical protein
MPPRASERELINAGRKKGGRGVDHACVQLPRTPMDTAMYGSSSSRVFILYNLKKKKKKKKNKKKE